ncbi:Rrf2 family transcriptional regulator [Iocasia frigidifontis]|uniref:Rrf2 family transcriptional regulator n=1 Tax=Iocasia fonsfrigidae TaxID=2682810 RepID=A0A8A7KNP3_9FIRM|nr:Rrf2 family transcriptional regulator [Iocasia fonsfrigidae]QTL99664.1 Rrf2 family transcriptional regulator [Iocasia fonsfrigidae]
MKLSRKSEYACLALIDLARTYDDGLLTIGELAEQNNIPKKYLEQILLILKGAGYVRSVRGVGGGYKLAQVPGEISIAEVIRLIDGPLAPIGSVSEYFYEYTPTEQNDKLLALFKDIRDYTADLLEKTTFKDLI